MWLFRVPNAPCGVESSMLAPPMPTLREFLMHRVELKVLPAYPNLCILNRFLMHRVELKATQRACGRADGFVPNAPCGVERTESSQARWRVALSFLMHRVELKGRPAGLLVSVWLSHRGS